MKSISEYKELIQNYIEEGIRIARENDVLSYKKYIVIGILIMSFLAVLMIVVGFKKTAIRRFKENLAESNKKIITRTSSRYVDDYISSPLSKHLDSIFKYSRFYVGKKFLTTSARYWGTSVIVSVLITLLGVIISKNTICFYLGVISLAVFYFVIYAKKYKNNVSIDKDLLKFINLIGNYSTGNTEVSSLFMQIAPKMHSPLRECLVECVAEQQNDLIDKNRAIRNLSAKIENAKVKEVLKNLELSQNYVSNFGIVAEQSRSSAFEYSKGRSQLKQMILENLIVLVICVGAIALILAGAGSVLGTNVFLQLITTGIGKVVIGIALFSLATFVFLLLGANK